MEAIKLTSLYTAVGRFERRTDENGQHPVVIVNGREHMVNVTEMIIWTCCNWRILELRRIEELYEQMARGAGADVYADIENYVERLYYRGLIVYGSGETGADALYDLLNSLYIVPVTSGFFVKAMAFLKFILVNRMPLNKAKTVFRKETLSDSEKRVVDLARQTQLSTAELIKCVDRRLRPDQRR